MLKLVLLLLLIFTSAVHAAVPIAEYHMDECSWNGIAGEVKDSAGSSAGPFDAKVDIVGKMSTTGNGYINRAGEFNKDNDIGAVAIPPAVLNGLSTFTFTTWIYLKDTDTNTKNTFLAAEGTDGSDSDDILFHINNGTIALKYRGQNYKNFSKLDSTKLFGGQWVFFALTKSNALLDNACAMINGGVDSSEYQCKNVRGGSLDITHLVLAQDRAGNQDNDYYPGSRLNGNMDEVKFYNTKLTQGELQALYFIEKDHFYHDGSTPAPAPCYGKAMAEYRFDECYWLNGAGGITGQVRDNSANSYDATETGTAQTDATDKIIGRSADMGSDNYLTMFNAPILPSTGWSLSTWVKFPIIEHSGSQYHIVGSYVSQGDLPYFTMDGNGNILNWAIWDNAGTEGSNTFPNTLSGWHHLLFSDDGDRTTLYIDGTLNNDIPKSTSGELAVLLTSKDGGYTTQTLGTKVDEYKLWDEVLGGGDAKTIYDYENTGKNYDDTERNATVCGASTSVDGWQLIGIPAEARAGKATITFANVFEEFNAANYKNNGASDGWIVFKPVYDGSVNKTTYGVVELTDNVEFGTGYWLLTKSEVHWETNDLTNADYDISKNTVPECAGNRCIELDVQSAVNDTSNGPNRYTMFGFVGKEPIQWGDCKVIVDGGIPMSIADAENANILSREIWYWATGTGSGSTGNVRSTDYISCNDSSIGGCTLIPHQGYWIRTQPGSIGKQIQILLPKGVDK